MTKKILFFWGVCMSTFLVKAQPIAPKYIACSTTDSLIIKDLRQKIKYGDKRALRDLGSFITTEFGANTLAQYLIIEANIYNVDLPMTRQTYLDFFYKNEKKLNFSPLFQSFYYQKLENLTAEIKHEPYKIVNSPQLFKKTSQSIEQFIQSKQIDSAAVYLESLPMFPANESYNWLVVLSKDERIARASQPNQIAFYRALMERLSFYRRESSFRLIMDIVEQRQLPPSLASWPLSRVTNVLAGHEVPDNQIIKRYKFYADSVKNYESLQLLGYERYRPNLQRSFFENDVDYYGALLALAFDNDSFWWIRHNALEDLLATHHPRSLFYLATQAYKERLQERRFGFQSNTFIAHIVMLTQDRMQVIDAKKQFTNDPTADLTAMKHYMAYWAAHWNDYEWDEYRNIFVNKQAKLAEKEQFERLFRRFSSTNDSVAMQSYRELTEGDPAEITRLATKYRGLLRNVNSNLPNFKYKFLEQIAILTDYCRQQNIRYTPTPEEEKQFVQLLDAPNPSSRYIVENKLIKSLTLEQVTPFEYWAMLHSARRGTNYSVSRVLDYWYSAHLQLIAIDKEMLRLYLKKTHIFTQTNAAGTASAYAKKIDKNQKKLRDALTQITENESDEHIKIAISSIIQTESSDTKNTTVVNKIDNSDAQNINQLVTALSQKSVLVIDDINQITQSMFFNENYRKICLESLAKVTPLEDIFLLKISPKLSIKNGELKYLSALPLNIKDLDDIPRITEVDDAATLFQFIMSKTQTSTIDELGGLVNNIFRATWFTNYLTSGNFDATAAANLRGTLERYLNESELISEFEEQTTARNIAQLESYNQPIEMRLQNVLRTDTDEDTKLKIFNEILARISYNEIPKVLPFVLQMESIMKKSIIAFLHDDFGIPIFEFENDKALLDFIERHKKLKEKDLYIIYLQKYGVEFQQPNGNLDFDKIYNILKFDLVTPFTEANGMRRDDYVYGIIKVLEFHFDTRLGFHPKLNESQTFYSLNAAKRTQAWMYYLASKGLLDPTKHSEVVSFN